MSDDKISIVIPCYNEEEHIAACIENMMAQTIGKDMLEVIVVNDGSTDNSWQILLGLEQKYPDNLMLINSEGNGRPGKVRNIGVSYATGNYLLFMDSDDLMVLDAIAIMYDKIKETGVDFVEAEHLDFGDADADKIQRVLDNEPGALDAFDTTPVIREGLYEMPTPAERKHYMQEWGERSCVWAILFDRAFYDRAELFFPEGVLMEECYFGELLMTECTRMYHLSSKLYLYYINMTNGIVHGNNMKKNYMNKHFSIAMLIEELKRRGTFEDFKDEVGWYYFHQVLLLTTHYMKHAFSDFPTVNYIEMKNYMKETFPDYLKAPFVDDGERTLYQTIYGEA